MKRVMRGVLMLCMLVPGILAGSTGMAAEYYVSPAGNDRNPGTKDKPFQTIDHARDRVSTVTGTMSEDIVVYLRGGTYELASSVIFDANDSGTNGHTVAYKAFPGETPIVSGGQAIKGWSLHDREKNIYKASVGDLEFRQIYVNGTRGVRARHPNRTSEVTLGEYLGGAGVTGGKPHQLNVQAAELSGWEKWSHLNEVEVVMITHWKQKRARIAGISGATISFQAPENVAPSMFHMEQGGTPHWYENAPEFLDAEGEFYLDTGSDTLFYKPRTDEDLSTAEVIAPKVEALFDFRGTSPAEAVHNLLIEGITFQYSNWTKPSSKGYQVMQSATWLESDGRSPIPGAIQLQNASDVVIRSCTVQRTGAHGIAAVTDVVSGCSISGNLVRDTSAGGIYLLLNDERSSGNTITDNTVERIGMEYSDGCGILVARTPDVSILHNEIRDVRYTGISTGWTWDDKDTAARNHDVGHNLIHKTMGLHDDGGGIYTLGKIPGMKVHDNYIHDLTRSRYSGNYGICGIYLDNGSCFKQVSNNVIENVEAAFFSGNKPNYKNVFENNYHNGPLAKVIEKENTVRDNTQVLGANWPKEAREIMKKAGPRGAFRRPKYVATMGRIGGAKSFDGQSGFVEEPHASHLDPEQLTLQAWIRLEEFPGGRDTRRWIVNKNGNELTEGHYALVINGERPGAYLNIGGGEAHVHALTSSKDSLTLGRWHHVAMTYDGKSLRLFVDGNEVAAKAIDRKRVGGSGGLAIGRRQDAYAPTSFKGRIDDVRLYNRPLEAVELKEHFDNPHEVDDIKAVKGLVGYWPF